MSTVSFTNFQGTVNALDKNNNNVMDELQADSRALAKIDTDRNTQVSKSELLAGLSSDAVEVSQGKIVESRSKDIFVHGLETLKSVHSTAANSQSWAHVWAPSFYADDTAQQRYNKVIESNRVYESGLLSMQTALTSIRDVTRNAPDATSKAIFIQADNALKHTFWNSFGTLSGLAIDMLLGYDSALSTSQTYNTTLQANYAVVNTTLQAIEQQTKNLPDMSSKLTATDSAIAKAFKHIQQIQSDSQTPQNVSEKLNRIADETQAQATGRTGPYAGIGAGVGAAAGAAIGFFAGGHDVKSALIGAGVGAAASAGIGALIGHSIDQKYLGDANALRNLAGEVTRYQPESAKASLNQESLNAYNELLNASDKHDLDNARVVSNNLDTISGRVTPIETQAAKILEAYKRK